jgi:prepilin-type processing-associated H-X9-DG protein/prepilin-type N-terminal cleavage/methylation domain-containing protein
LTAQRSIRGGTEAARFEFVNLPRSQAGFSFIELIVVMCIGVVLYAMVAGPSEATKRKREMAQCTEHLRKLHLTLGLYAAEHDGKFPAVPGARRTEDVLRVLAPKYTTDATFLACPVEGGGYSYVMGLKKADTNALIAADRLRTPHPASGGTIFDEKGNHGAGGNLLFTDGHVETVGATAPRNLTLPPGAILLNP